MRFQNGSNKVAIELRVLQFWSEIILVISNQTRAVRSFGFEITRMISDQIALHSLQLSLFIPPFKCVKSGVKAKMTFFPFILVNDPMYRQRHDIFDTHLTRVKSRIKAMCIFVLAFNQDQIYSKSNFSSVISSLRERKSTFSKTQSFGGKVKYLFPFKNVLIHSPTKVRVRGGECGTKHRVAELHGYQTES